MEDIKTNKVKPNELKENMSLTKKVDIIYDSIERGKIKQLKIPRKAKVRRGKIKKGWIGILRIDENGNISGEKQKLEDSTYRLKDGTYHTMDGSELLFWQGKFPVVFQPTWRDNPLTIRQDMNMQNETYGQKYIMAKMLKDAITLKNKSGSWIIWILIIGAVIFGANYFFNKK